MIKGQWARSEKEGVRWDSFSGLDEFAYKAILEHFSLTPLKDSLPLDRVMYMSYKELRKLRSE